MIRALMNHSSHSQGSMPTSPRPSWLPFSRIGVGSTIGSPIERGISATPVEML